AVDQVIAQAASAMTRGEFEGSVQLILRAQERWEPSVDRQLALNRVLRDTHLTWARSDISASRFLSAYTHGEAAAAVPGFSRGAAEAIQAEALRRGTVLVAVFPAGARG